MDTQPPIELMTVEDVMEKASVSRTVAYEIAHEIGVTRVAKNAIRVRVDLFNQYMLERTTTPKRKTDKRKLKRAVDALLTIVEDF